MKNRLLLSLLLALTLSAGRGFAVDLTPAAKPGYRVVVEIEFKEDGTAGDMLVLSSDDPTGDQMLNQMALKMAVDYAGKNPQKPHEKDGKPVKFKVAYPFDFPVEGDEGAEANKAPRPAIKSAEQPVYPPALGAQGEVGGVIAEIQVGADGQVKEVKILRASHPEFAEAVQTVLPRWQFRPALSNGDPVPARCRLAIVFATDDKMPDFKWRLAPRPSVGSYTVVHSKAFYQYSNKAANAAPGTPAAPAPAPTPAPVPPAGK